MKTCTTALVAVILASLAPLASAADSDGAPGAPAKMQPNLIGKMALPLRYKPDGSDFVIENGPEFFNRPLYGGNTAFRVDGGDRPEFTMYLPGRGGNLRLGIKTAAGTKWLKDADRIVTRYRPGELIYEVHDRLLGTNGVLNVEVLAYANTEGLAVRTEAKNIAGGAELIWAYGGVNGERGGRDGDIGTEKLPVTDYFQLQPEFADGNSFALAPQGFTLKSTKATIAGVVPDGAKQHLANADDWNNLTALMASDVRTSNRPVVTGSAPMHSGTPLFISLQRVADTNTKPQELNTYQDVTTQKVGTAVKRQPAPLLPVFTPAQLPGQFATTRKHFDDIRNKVRIETPDPYLDASVGALNIVSDALWDDTDQAIMHGSIAWRAKLLGWRGPYVLDALGWHDRARQNFNTWTPRQNTSPITAIPTPDPKSNLARNEPGLHSNGDISGTHYDMNMVFMDALFRHLLWTGDTEYAKQVWPVIERHVAWEKRLFRREYGPDKLPIYEAYTTIWASDGLYNAGGGSAYASAYNVYANRMAARVAVMAGKDPTPYTQEADAIEKGMRGLLWMPDEGTFAEAKDVVGNQLVHRDYALWNFYHTIDEEAVTPREAWSMGTALSTHLPAIPVEGPGVPNDRPYHVLSETDWMPYMWSINNVVMDENMHTALALWQGGHAEDAYQIAKGAILASQYMGISPGNLGTMNVYDVNRRESQRDFGDSAGTMSRTMIEGLFGIRPDAMAGTLTVAPGFPSDWTHAKLVHPDIGLNFVRSGMNDQWNVTQPQGKFKTVTLRIPAAFSNVASVTVNGASVKWHAVADAVGRPMLEITIKAGPATGIRIQWAGEAMTANAVTTATRGKTDGNFVQMTRGAFTWWAQLPMAAKPEVAVVAPFDWNAPMTGAKLTPIDLTSVFNDKVSAIFAPGKYLTPRAQGVSLSLPSQGIGAWTGFDTMVTIDDSGLRKTAAAHDGKLVMPNGVPFATPGAADVRNIAFTSQWDTFPRELTVPLSGNAKRIYLLMAGSTNHQQSRMDNGEVIVTYTDGTTSRLALRNPETWWPIQTDYFIDDYQFRDTAPMPARINLKTGEVRVLDQATFKGKGRDVPGGAATALNLALDPTKTLRSLTVRTITNEVVIGLMSATLERP